MINKTSFNNSDNTLGLLGVAFVVLKLTGNIAWSWWWVTAPFWGMLVILAVMLVGMGIFAWLKK